MKEGAPNSKRTNPETLGDSLLAMANLLSKSRYADGKTLDQIARELKVTYSSARNWENYDNPRLPPEELQYAMALAYGTTIEKLRAARETVQAAKKKEKETRREPEV